MAFDPVSAVFKGAGTVMDMMNAERNRDLSNSIAQQNMAQQEQFAKMGIRWKVADAKEAGIHPLYALGASTHSFSPVSIGGGAQSSYASDLGSMGQDISRAVGATQTKEEKVDGYVQATQKIALERGALENEILKSRLARERQASSPGIPAASTQWLMPGQGDTPAKDNPQSRVQSAPGAPAMEHAAIPDITQVQTGKGYYPVPGKDVKERIEDNVFHEAMHFFRNNVLPFFGLNRNVPPNLKPGPKEYTFFHPVYGYQVSRPRRWERR